MTSTTQTVKASLVPFILAVVVLYFGREFFIPLALAILISFLLAPLVGRLERWRLGRIGSVIAATLLAFSLVGGIGFLVVGQLIDLANELPTYRENLQQKAMSLRSSSSGPVAKVSAMSRDLSKIVSGKPALPPNISENSAPGSVLAAVISATTEHPMRVEVVEPPGNVMQTLQTVVGPLLGPLGTAAVVLIFVIFILLEHEDLRDRVIHLIGRGHLRVTTQALDEAARRVSKYLVAQCIVNVTYGFPIGVGLYFIGVPNAPLWGLLATVLRFIPYLGPWIASAFPLLLSLAVSSGWGMPLATLGLFLVVELISNNVVEPWLYGASTGLSPMAVIVAAAFWTWLWGTIGLLLATPLTFCIAVLGKYIPQLTFLDVLLGDKPPISPEDRFYQRLLAGDEVEVTEIAETYREKHTLGETLDRLLLPALRLAEEDHLTGGLTEAARNRVYETVRDLIPELPDEDGAPPPADLPKEPIALCVSANDYADEVAGLMLAKLLAQSGQTLSVVPSTFLASEMLEAVESAPTRLICISTLPPGSTRHAIYICKRLRDRFPEARIVVGLWAEPLEDDARARRFRTVKIDGLVRSLQDMVKEICATGRVVATKAETPASA